MIVGESSITFVPAHYTTFTVLSEYCVLESSINEPHDLDFASAETQFDRIIALDPYRLDDMDIFSNILYVAENRTKLSRLAHHLVNVDRDRPEVCCLIGASNSIVGILLLTQPEWYDR